ncbi:hypothetical protein HGA88_02465 [Candidatus Roizmanbacteria bacterium]|nr:hypothetical protein [Candidatus Roizmanbacteria bacterium]
MEPLHAAQKFFHAFSVLPEKTHFESQAPDEKIVLVLRAHPITQLPWIFNTIALVFLIVVSTLYLPLFVSGRQIFVFDIFGFVFVLSYAWFNILNWYYNVGIITDKRIVDVDFSAIIYKEVTATRLNKVEDITSKSGGYFGSVFNFGDVFIQTAGAETNIEFLKVPDPSGAVNIINQVLGK